MRVESATWNDCLEYAAVTDVGLRRMNNQDSFVAATAGSVQQWRRRGHLFTVADGMGAHAAGERASQLAVDNVPLTYNKLTQLPPPIAIRKAIHEANTVIHERGQNSVDFHGMGTTCSTLLLLPEGAFMAHVGDSRIYRLRGHVLDQLTFDHSLVWEMAEAGHVSETEIPQYVPKNVITRSLGPHPSVQVDLEGPLPLEVGDTFLICTDGLTGSVKNEEIGALLGCLPTREAAETLCDLANLRGGPDNITLLVVRVAGTIDAKPARHEEREADPKPARPVAPSLWAAMAALVVLSLVLLALGYQTAAAVTGASFLLTALAAWLSRFGGTEPAETTPGQYGNGPYRSCDCQPSRELSQTFADIDAQLNRVAAQGGWQLETVLFEHHIERAEAAAADEDWRTSVTEYCRAIRCMMQQLRQQRKEAASDSGIDLARD